jgi:hypothetical protein
MAENAQLYATCFHGNQIQAANGIANCPNNTYNAPKPAQILFKTTQNALKSN